MEENRRGSSKTMVSNQEASNIGKTTATMNKQGPRKSSAKMSVRSVVLRRKLQELESELAEVFRRPVEPTAPDPRRQISFDDIKQRFSFLTKLLAAEVESQPQASGQLHEIDERLGQLKADFRDWDKSRSCFFRNPDDTMSICSDCTQALLYDGDDGGSGSEPEEDEVPGENPPLLEEGERRRSEMGRYCGAFGCGMIVGAVMISMVAVKMLSSSDYVLEYEAFLLPPPT